jgi:O-antigen/teichoic acid export membrane protein
VVYAISDILIRSLYTEAYQGVAALMRQLAVVFLLITIEQSYSHLLIAAGRPRDKVIGQAMSIGLFAAGLLPAFHAAGLEGVVMLLAAAAAMRAVWTAFQLHGLRVYELAFDGLVLGLFFLLAHGMYAAVGAYDNRWYQTSMAFAVGVSALLVSVLAYRRMRRQCEGI